MLVFDYTIDVAKYRVDKQLWSYIFLFYDCF